MRFKLATGYCDPSPEIPYKGGFSNGGGKHYAAERNKQKIQETKQAIIQDARRWLRSDHFITVCECVGVDANAIRNDVFQMRSA